MFGSDWYNFKLNICCKLYSVLESIISYFILLLSHRSLFSSNERYKGSALDGKEGGKELGGAEGGETTIRIYYARRESILNKKGEKKPSA